MSDPHASWSPLDGLETEAEERLPYPGLRPFRRDEIDVFFGRDQQVYSVLDRLAASRFLAVVGASGCGKSSLVRCGLLGGLESGLVATAGSRWRVADMRPGDHPMRQLARALLDEAALGAELAEDTEAFLLRELAQGPVKLVDTWKRARPPDKTNLILLVDQFEEIFRFRREHDSNEADAFVDMLIETVKRARRDELPIYVVLTMRSEFLGDCALFSGLPEMLNDSQYLTPKLERDEYREVIEGPATVFGGEVEPALVTRLLNDMYGVEDALPLMQHLLMRLWKAQAGGDGAPTLTVADYEAEGGIANSLSNHAEQLYQSLDGDQRRVARSLFQRLADDDLRRPTPVREIARVAEVDDATVCEIADRFRDRDSSFLMPPAGEPLDADTTLDISHEALLRRWKRLRGWEAEEEDWIKTYKLLVENARNEAAGQGQLYRGGSLRNARQWARRSAVNAAWAERYGEKDDWALATLFLERSQRAQRRRTLAIAGSIVFLVAAGLVTWGRWSHLRNEIVNAYNLLEHSRRNVDDYPQRSLWGALEASRVPTVRPSAHNFIRETLGRNIGRSLEGGGGTIAVAGTRGGRWLASVSAGGLVRLWETSGPEFAPIERELGKCFGDKADRVVSRAVLALDETGSAQHPPGVAIGDPDGCVEIWRAGWWSADGWPEPAVVHVGPENTEKTENVYRLALSDDGRHLARADAWARIDRWDLDGSGDREFVHDSLEGKVQDPFDDFRLDFRKAAIAATWGLFPPTSGDRGDGGGLPSLSEGEDVIAIGRYYLVTFSIDESDRDNKQRQIWVRELSQGSWGGRRLLFEGLKEVEPLSYALAERDNLLVTGHADGRVRLWLLDEAGSDPRWVLPALEVDVKSEHESVVEVLYRGKLVAARSGSGTVRFWRLDEAETREPMTIEVRGYEGEVTRIASDWQGRWIFAATTQGETRYWDSGVESGDCRSLVTARGERVGSLQVSPDGRWAAQASGATNGQSMIKIAHLRSPVREVPIGRFDRASVFLLHEGSGELGGSSTLAYLDPSDAADESGGQGEVVLHPLATRTETGWVGGSDPIELKPPPRERFSPVFASSPDNRFIVVAGTREATGDSRLWVLDREQVTAAGRRAAGSTCKPPSIESCAVAELAIDGRVTAVISGPRAERLLVAVNPPGEGRRWKLFDRSSCCIDSSRHAEALSADLTPGPPVHGTPGDPPDDPPNALDQLATALLSEHWLAVGTRSGAVARYRLEDLADGTSVGWENALLHRGGDETTSSAIARLELIPGRENERWLASVGKDGQALLFDLESAGPSAKVLLEYPGVLSHLAFSDDGELLLIGSEDGTVEVRRLDQREPAATMAVPRLGGASPGRGDAVVAGVLTRRADSATAEGVSEPLAGYELVIGSKDGTVCHWQLGMLALEEAVGTVVSGAARTIPRPEKYEKLNLD